MAGEVFKVKNTPNYPRWGHENTDLLDLLQPAATARVRVFARVTKRPSEVDPPPQKQATDPRQGHPQGAPGKARSSHHGAGKQSHYCKEQHRARYLSAVGLLQQRGAAGKILLKTNAPRSGQSQAGEP